MNRAIKITLSSISLVALLLGTLVLEAGLVFPVRNQDELTLHPKAIISYVWKSDEQTPKNRFSGANHQFPHQEIERVGTKVVDFNDRQIRARWDDKLETVIVEELDGTRIPSSTAFAFVYPAFFPE